MSRTRPHQVRQSFVRVLTGLGMSLLLSPPVQGINPFPSYGRYPCIPASQSCQLFVPVQHATQIKRLDRSPNSSCAGADSSGNCTGPFQGFTCPGSNQWCTTPSVGNIKNRMIAGTRQLEFDVEYDFPNNYCHTWDPPNTWPIDGFGWPASGQITRLRLYSTDSGGGNRVLQIASVPAAFEYGRWLPQITLAACSLDAYYQVEVQGCAGSISSPVFHVVVQAEDCTQVEPFCSPSASMGPGGVPIGFQAGSLTTPKPTWSEAPAPGPLVPRLFYNGNNPDAGGLGPSWFFTYGDRLVPGAAGTRVWIDHSGFRRTYTGNDASGYLASDPGDAEGRVDKDPVTGDYVLSTPDGVRRTFVSGSNGFWKKTVDRWGNGAAGNATTTARATQIDELLGGATSGRLITLAYDSGGRLTSSTDLNSPAGTTRFGYEVSGRLQTICSADQDANCPATATPWRRFAYLGNTLQLVSVTDRLGSIIRGYEYNASNGVSKTWRGPNYTSGKEATEYVPSGGAVPKTILVKRRIDATTSADTTYTVEAVAGVWRVKQIAGVCPECGEENSTRTFDGATGRVTVQVNGNGATTTFGYDGDGNLLQMIEDSAGLMRTTTFTYAVPGTDALPSVWPTASPPSAPRDFWKTKTEPSGAKPGSTVVTTRTWAGSGNLELSETVNGYLSSAGSAVPRTTKITYDALGRVLATDGPRPLPTSDVTTHEYYPAGDPLINRYRLLRTNGPDGTKTKFEYHPLGGITKLTREITPGSNADVITEYTYDAVGRRSSETIKKTTGTSESDFITTYGYDVAGRLTSSETKEGTNPSLTKTVLTYEAGTDRLLTRANPDGRFPNLGFGESGERTVYAYDDRGNVTSEIYGYFNGGGTAAGFQTTHYQVNRTYDGLCRVKKQIFPLDAPMPDPTADDAITRYVYDCAGNLTGIVDANHYVTDATLPNLSYSYDALNRLTSLTRTASPSNDLTSYAYDLRDQLTSVTDPNGASTTYVVDDFGGLRKQVTPLAGGGVADETTYGYDEANNLTSVTQTGIRASSRTYDAAGRLTSISGTVGPLTQVNYTYDTACLPDPVSSKVFGQGRLCKVALADLSIITEYAYDRRGLVVKEKTTLVASPGTKVYELTYQYDAAGRRKLVTYPSGDSVMANFDVNSRPLDFTYVPSVGTPSKLLGKIAHQVSGPIRSFQTSENLQEARTFDTRFRRLTQRTFSLATNPASLLMGWQYGDGRVTSTAYDKEGNLKTVNDVTPGISPPSNRAFGYDPDRYFLTSSTGPYGTSWAEQKICWEYDKNGNRVIEKRLLPTGVCSTGAVTTAYTYENDGAGHSNGVIASLTPPGGTVNHLSSGDLNTDEQGIQYTYDALGRLTQAQSVSGCTPVAKNVWKRDPAGHRVIREVHPCNSSLSKTEYFVYGFDGSLHYREAYNASNVLTDREAYVYLEGEPVAILRTFGSPTGNFFLHNDHLGRPFAMSGPGPAGMEIKWKREFEPFGKSLGARVSLAFEPGFRFPGQWEYSDSGDLTGNTTVFDKINALEDNWNRTYAQRWGRYTQPDPIGLRGGINLFSYAEQNPLNRVDPRGLSCSKDCPECPGGFWLCGGVTANAFGAFGVLGAGVQVLKCRCQSNGMTCSFATPSFKAGAGASLSATVTACAIFKGFCVDQILGLAAGADVDVGGGRGVSGNVSFSTGGSIQACGEAGLVAGLSGGGQTSYTFKLGCRGGGGPPTGGGSPLLPTSGPN